MDCNLGVPGSIKGEYIVWAAIDNGDVLYWSSLLIYKLHQISLGSLTWVVGKKILLCNDTIKQTFFKCPDIL